MPLLLGKLKHFDLLLLLTQLSFISSATWNTTLKQSNLLLELLLLFPHLIDALDQVDVILHESCVAFSVLLKAASQLAAVVLDVGLISFTFTSALTTLVGSLRSLACLLFLDPSLVETHDASLQFLVVGDVLDNLEYIVLETFLSEDLNVKGMSASQVFFLKTLVAHLKILNDEFQVCADGLEVLHFDLHLIDLFVQRGNIVFTGKDITLQFLDLIIKHELELFKLLSLLFEFNNASVFVFNGGCTRSQFTFLVLDLVLKLEDSLVKVSKRGALLLDILEESFSGG